jgi:hypothetical protein
MFTYLPNLKSISATFEATPPWQKTSPCGGVPAGISKTAFAKWCSDSTTDHVFFTMTEGLIPTIRVGRDNPPRKVYGVVGDYDSDSLVHKTDAEIVIMIQTAVTKGGIHPNQMSRTFQNKIRLIWIFEKGIPGDPDEMLKQTIALFKTRAKLEQMMPGLDATGLEPSHYFEQGHSWTDFGKPLVSVAIMDMCVFSPDGWPQAILWWGLAYRCSGSTTASPAWGALSSRTVWSATRTGPPKGSCRGATSSVRFS